MTDRLSRENVLRSIDFLTAEAQALPVHDERRDKLLYIAWQITERALSLEPQTLYDTLIALRGTADSDINVVKAAAWLDRYEPIFDEDCPLEMEDRYARPVVYRTPRENASPTEPATARKGE